MYMMSLLRDEVLLIDGAGRTISVGEFREGISGEKELEHDSFSSFDQVKEERWYIAEKDTWSMDARHMVMNYLRDSSANEEVSGWYAKARELVYNVDFNKIEKIIMDELRKDETLLVYYRKGEEVKNDLV